MFVILSEAKNLSADLPGQKKERFFASLRMTTNVEASAAISACFFLPLPSYRCRNFGTKADRLKPVLPEIVA
jgi:hypothetical protein